MSLTSNVSVVPDALYLTSDVARVFRVSAETVRDWERSGRLPAKRTLGGVRLFEGRDVVRFQQTREASVSGEAVA
jgi:DNA-binding transcriptional MerR regulator